jgi:signal transduction histidine kinase
MVVTALSNQIRRAVSLARNIAEGNEVHGFSETTNDELGELLRVMEDMARKVQTRTLELTREVVERKQAQEELIKMKDAAEAANRAKSEFLANMSHEVRTPVNGIMGMIDLTLASKLEPEQREFLDLAKLSADSLITVINDILDFSKIEAKKLDLECQPFDLHEDLSDTLCLLAPRAFQKGLVEDVYAELIRDVERLIANMKNVLRSPKILEACE